MSAALETVDISVGSEKIISIIDRDGGVIVKNYISSDLCQQIERELQSYVDSFEPGIPGDNVKSVYSGAQTKRFSGLAAKSPAYAQVIDHNVMHAWARHAFKTDYWMSTSQAMLVGPGSTNQFLHRDVGNWALIESLGRDAPEAAISMMLAVREFTAEIGATRVVPGSHKWDDYSKDPEPEDVTQAVMPAGSALLYSGRTIHGAGANTTENQWRFGISMMFVRSDMTPEEAICFTTPWEIAQNYSERVQHMLGYFSLRPLMPDAPTLWTYDYRELRDHLKPAPRTDYTPGVGILAADQDTSALVRLVAEIDENGIPTDR